MSRYDRAFYFSCFAIFGISVGVAVEDALLSYLIVLFAVLAVFLLQFGRGASYTRSIMYALIAVLLVWYVHAGQSAEVQIPIGTHSMFSGRVVRDVIETAKEEKITIALNEPHAGIITIYDHSYPDIRHGDVVTFLGVMRRSAYGRLYVVDPEIHSITQGERTITRALFSAKQRIIDVFQETLPTKHAALMSGILLGYRADFSPAFEEAMRRSGTTHIVALSGYNISVIIVLLSGIGFLILPETAALILMIGSIFGFVIATGSEESLVRAALMGTIALIAYRSGMTYGIRNAITLTALAMLLWNPLYITSVGFQLSFAALLGIVYLKPLIDNWIGRQEHAGFLNWKENFTTTLSAQLAVTPILLWTFKSVSLVAVAANVLVLWVIPFTMIGGALLGIVGIISQSAALPIAWAVNILLSYQIAVITFFSHFALVASL